MSGQEHGVDSCGRPVRAGERDRDGTLVGFVDASGLAWESAGEAQAVGCAGRFYDAFNDYNRSGGALGVPPAPDLSSVEDENEPAALGACADALRFLWLSAPARARTAQLN